MRSYTTPKSFLPCPSFEIFSQICFDLSPSSVLHPTSPATARASLMSLSMRSQAKPRSQSREAGTFSMTPGTGLQVSTLQQREEDTFMMLVRIFWSMPNFAPKARASEMPIISIASAMLLHTFAICPAPILSQLKMLFPMHSRQGFTLSKMAAFSAPTINVRVPAAEPVTPPDTGASTQVIPKGRAAWLSAMATVGEIVLQSMTRESLGALAKIPPSAWQTLWECSELGSMVMKTEASLATCLISDLKVMLCFLASSALRVSISKAKTSCPFLARLTAMGKPILPSPTNPTRAKAKQFLVISCMCKNEYRYEDTSGGGNNIQFQQEGQALPNSLLFYLPPLHCRKKGNDYDSDVP